MEAGVSVSSAAGRVKNSRRQEGTLVTHHSVANVASEAQHNLKKFWLIIDSIPCAQQSLKYDYIKIFVKYT